MKKKFWDKRIPSFLGLLFLAISVGMVSWFGKSYTELRSKASMGETPKNVQISNITDTSFTVSYVTSERAGGGISYGRDKQFGQVGLDERDQQIGKSSARWIHYVTISQLDPGTKYYFAIQSGTKVFLNNNQPYEVTTASTSNAASLSTTSPNQEKVVAGSVYLPDGSIPMEGIVYISTASMAASQLLSGLLKPGGSYNIPISSIILNNDTILQIIIQNGSYKSRVSVKAAHTNPVPPVMLSKDYDFTIDTYDTSVENFTASESATASPSGTLSPGAPVQGFPLFSSKVASEPAILTPKDAEKFIDQQPLFKGTAFPNATVEIIIESPQEIQTSVQADNFGNWQFRPTTPLSPGQHVVTILTLDASGVLRSIKRSFTVFAQGSQFTEPSISPIFSPTPTASASPTPLVLPTPTTLPTATPTPTLAPTFVLTPTLLQTITPVITVQPTSPSIPPSGSSSLFIGGLLAVLSITAGFVLFFF